MKNPDKRGVKGMIPPSCLPLRGREGVALMAPVREYAYNRENRISSKLNDWYFVVLFRVSFSYFTIMVYENRFLVTRTT